MIRASVYFVLRTPERTDWIIGHGISLREAMAVYKSRVIALKADPPPPGCGWAAVVIYRGEVFVRDHAEVA